MMKGYDIAPVGVAVTMLLLARGALSDDAVGVVRVDAGTNGVVQAVMPFEPMDVSGPSGYVSGAFLGDGGPLSDRLFRQDALTGATTDAVWSAGVWLDPFVGLPSFMQAFPGDWLTLLREDAEPFSFFLRGRVPGVASGVGSPRFRSVSVDPAGGFADFSVFTRGLATDLFSSDVSSDLGVASPWAHVGRYPGHTVLFGWRDASLPASGGRVYLAADATRDGDGDGLPDEMEVRVYGTSPRLADTDGDGVSDALELAWGSDPLVADSPSPLALFAEPFEEPEVARGPLVGQNGWTVRGQFASAAVQGDVVHGGASALALGGGTAAHAVTGAEDVVWMDLRLCPDPDVGELEEPEGATVFFYFNRSGCPVMTDGDAFVTNFSRAVPGRRWVRCTARLDYAARTWDLYVDGALAGAGLAMRGNAPTMGALEMNGTGAVDDLRIAASRPPGLSSDGDGLPDEWEVAHFGDLSHDGSADTDGDGMTDLAEFLAGTDPLVPEIDTDGDGLPDWWEAANGLDPLGTNDCAALPDASAGPAEVVWTDFRLPGPRVPGVDGASVGTLASVLFDGEGHPVLSDGEALSTNLAASAAGGEGAARCTFRLDFPNGRWDFYLDGVLVSSNLAMRGTAGASGALASAIAAGAYVGIARPAGLSSDGDALPDEWEFRNFGDLSRDGSGDFDGDGVADLAEFLSGTDPALADSDGDGLPDGWEAANGMDPLDPDDAWLDPDGDGYPDGVEFAAGTDPRAADAVVPVGYVPGLDVAYYAFDGALQSMPDVSGLAPCATCVWETVDQAATNGPWAGAPDGLADRYAVVASGALLVPEVGLYRLTLSSDDGSRLWVDGVLAVDHGTTHAMSSKSASVRLSAGLHELAVEYFENTGNAGLRLLWSRDGAADAAVPAGCLFRPSGDASADGDGDGLPDWWEWKNALDAADPADAARDPDGDGLDNLSEFLHGADPRSPDTDGDGMPDGWEAANGLCPFADDADGDPDGDGLTNAEECRAGTSPFAADTDGDGLDDYVEASQLGTDPAVADLVAAGAPAALSQAGRGVAFEVQAPMAYVVAADLLHEWRDYAGGGRPAPASNRVVFRVDGHFVDCRDVPFDCSNVVRTVFYTPVLPVGAHEVSVEWCSPDFRARAALVGLAVNEVTGVDFGEVVRRRNSAPAGALSSRVSPAFVEGTARFPWLVSCDGAAARPLGAGSWYADVPLAAGTDTVCAVLFEGLSATNVTVAWEATDLFAGAADVSLRRGSRLLMAGAPPGAQGGTVSVFTNDAPACAYRPGSSAPLAFGCDGEWLVRAVWTSEDGTEATPSGTILVSCAGGAFPAGSPACFAGQARAWPCPGLPPGVVFDADAFTHVSLSADGVATLLVDDTRGERLVAARLGEGGPVLDVARIDPMWAVDSFGNVAYLAAAAADHDRCRCYLRQYGAPESARFRIRSYTSSVLLDDYSTERWIGPEAFDRDGIAWFELVKSKDMASACHTVVVYQDGVRVGEAVYGNGTLPEELR